MTAYVYWIRGEKYADMGAISARSVRKVDPKARIHVFSDDPTSETARACKWADVFHGMVTGRPAMVANLDAQIAALEYLERGERVLFLDVDTVMRKPFPWCLSADLYVTYRTEILDKDGNREEATVQPYNYGVVGAHNCAAALEAFMWMRYRVLQMSASRAQIWYGNQLALADLVGGAPKEGDETIDKRVRIRWTIGDFSGRELAVRQLPCSTWNFSPQPGDDCSNAGILHFKGGRKDQMQAYVEAAAA